MKFCIEEVEGGRYVQLKLYKSEQICFSYHDIEDENICRWLYEQQGDEKIVFRKKYHYGN